MQVLKYLYYFLLFILVTSCSKEENFENLVDSTVSTYRRQLPKKIIFFSNKNNKNNKNGNNYIFLDAKGLLDLNDEKFLCLYIKNDKNFKTIEIQSFQTGKIFKNVFDITGKLTHKEVIEAKPTPSKAYYIYYEILRRKYPNYMKWDLFPIPKDSLK